MHLQTLQPLFRVIFLTVLWASFTGHLSHAAEVITILGDGVQGYRGDDGLANKAQCAEPFGVVIGPDGALYICETKNHIIRRVDLKTNIVTTVAGTGKAGYSGDGGGPLQATLHEPYEIRFDSQGNIFFVEMLNHVVRKIDVQQNVISTYAGSGRKGYYGDGGPATRAMLSQPHSICFDKDENLYICDISNQRVRVVDRATGIISTFLGNGRKAPLTDGASIGEIPVSGPRALDFDGQDLWLALREGNAVYRLNMEPRTITHIAERVVSRATPAITAPCPGHAGRTKGIAIDQHGNIAYRYTESHTRRELRKTGLTPRHRQWHHGTSRCEIRSKCRLNRPHIVWL
ncbi:MAG: hypothetical protein R3C12_16595 [Planctomycetaceae bacterium]